MHNFSFNDNDDDIFDDDKLLNDNSSFINSSSSSSSSSRTNNPNDLRDLIDALSSDDHQKSFSILSGLVISFYKSSIHWIESDRDDEFKKAISSYLSDLSVGKAKPFPYYEKYYYAQNDLLKRRILNIFVGEVIKNPEEIEKFANKIDMNIDAQSISTYFASFYNVNQFTILEQYSHYKTLAEYLSLPFSDAVMQDVSDVMAFPMSYSETSNNLFSQIISEDKEFKDILSSNLSEAIKKFVKIVDNENISDV